MVYYEKGTDFLYKNEKFVKGIAEEITMIEFLLLGVMFFLGVLGLFFYLIKEKERADQFFMVSGILCIPSMVTYLCGDEYIAMLWASILDIAKGRTLKLASDYTPFFYILAIAMGILALVIRKKVGWMGFVKSVICCGVFAGIGAIMWREKNPFLIVSDWLEGISVTGRMLILCVVLVVGWYIWGIRKVRRSEQRADREK